MFAPLLLSLSAILSLPFSAAAYPHSTHDNVVKKALPNQWYHPEDHPVYALFRRDASGSDGVQYAQVGSPTWAAPFPTGTPDINAMPKPWVDALNAAVAGGKIPNIPVPSLVNSNPTYPQGVNPNGQQVCSAYYKCRMPDDIWDAPNGTIGIGFDDGPSLGSSKLYDFLQQNNQHATHFMIGINILYNPNLFTRAFNDLQNDIALHTWTHRSMSTLSNMELISEFAWTMEIIHNSTGGRLPRYWRPPYGDADNRVRAIAKEVFGLETIIWNQDTEDWSLTSGGTTPQAVNASMTKWLTGSKSPGLIILEHELSTQSAQAFEDAYPLMVSQGWKLPTVTSTTGDSIYLNADNSTSSVELVNGVLLSNVEVATSSASSPASSGSSPGSGSSSSGTKTGSGSTPSKSGTSSASNGALQQIANPHAVMSCLAAVFAVAFFA